MESSEDDTVFINIEYDESISGHGNIENKIKGIKKEVLASKKTQYCGLDGYGKPLRTNNFCIANANDKIAPAFNPDDPLYKRQLEKNLTTNILYKGQWGGYYYLQPPIEKNFAHTSNIRLASESFGDLESLHWIKKTTVQSNNTVQVCFAGPSLRDCYKSIGMLKCEDNAYGMDFSGINNRSEKVMGLIANGALSGSVVADPSLLWRVPDYWSLEDAATVPLPYVHAYYCLFIRAKLEENTRVFVTGGTGAFAQAVISISLSLKCTVFTSVSTLAKKQTLLGLFPDLKDENILPSWQYTLSFLKCDYVISGATGKMRECAMQYVANFGSFLDVNDHDRENNTDLNLAYFMGNKFYIAVRISNLFREDNLKERKFIQQMVLDGIRKGIVKPLVRVVYPPEKVRKSFRLMTSRKCYGRVLIKMEDFLMLNLNLEVVPKISFSPYSTFVVICGSNVLGFEIADWLIKRGAKKMVCHNANGFNEAYFYAKREVWNKSGVVSILTTQSLETEEKCIDLLSDCEKLNPVNGLFIVLEENKTYFTGEIVNNVTVVNNLDKVSRDMCSALRYFVVVLPLAKTADEHLTISAIEDICNKRSDVNLPTLVLHNQLAQKSLTRKGLICLLKSVERSLKHCYSNVKIGLPKIQNKISLMKKILNLIGITDINAVEENIYLNDLRLTEFHLNELRNLINRTLQIDFTTEELKLFSIQRLNQIVAPKKKSTQTVDGLNTFYNCITYDEMDASEPIVIMPSKITDYYMEKEVSAQDTYLIMIPGFEGHNRIFSAIGDRLKILAATLQLPPDLDRNNIVEIATTLMNDLKANFVFNNRFYILGYSFGVNVALELAQLFESEGYSGVVYCLDSSPDALKAQIDTYLGELTQIELQDNILIHFYQLMTGYHNKELDQDLKHKYSWTEKVEACVKILKNKGSLSHEYTRLVIEAFYKRMIMAKDYQPDFKLYNSEIVLIKAIPHPNASNLDADYGLSKYTDVPIKIFNIESDHALAPYDNKVPNFINKMLDTKVLEEYKKRNQCEVYLNNIEQAFF